MFKFYAAFLACRAWRRCKPPITQTLAHALQCQTQQRTATPKSHDFSTHPIALMWVLRMRPHKTSLHTRPCGLPGICAIVLAPAQQGVFTTLSAIYKPILRPKTKPRPPLKIAPVTARKLRSLKTPCPRRTRSCPWIYRNCGAKRDQPAATAGLAFCACLCSK